MSVPLARRTAVTRRVLGSTSLARCLLLRETGRHFTLVCLMWLLLGVGVAILDARTGAAPLPSFIGWLIHDFPDAFAYVIGALAAVQIMSRISDDRLRGWLLGWCGHGRGGGGRDAYVLGLFAAVIVTMSTLYVISAAGYTVGRSALGADTAVTRTATVLVRGVGVIAAAGAYGLAVAAAVQRLAAALTIAVLLLFVPPIIIAIIVVTQDLPAAPAAARLVFAHIPPLNRAADLDGFLRQFLYTCAAIGTAGAIGRMRIARVA